MTTKRPITPFTLGVEKRRQHFLRKHAYAESFRRAGLDGVADKLKDCQEIQVLALCQNCGKGWWIIEKCRQRVCPLCSYEVSKERSKYILAITRKMKYPKLLTFTMPLWQDDPHDGIKYLREAWNKLRRTKLMESVRGGCYSIELKVKDEGYHIHMHALVDSDYLPYQKVFSEWRRILDIEHVEIDIRCAENQKAREYVAKYTAKAAGYDTNETAIVKWYLATKGERLFATFGAWYNAKLEELLPEEQVFVPKCICPYCGKEGTVYLARDGPYVYGHEIWQKIEAYLVPNGIWGKPIEGVKEILEGEKKE